MTSTAREFLDFWIENSIQASEQYGSRGGAQKARDLADRCVNMAETQNVTLADIESEVGSLAEYIHSKMTSAQKTEDGRTDRHQNK